MITTHTSSLAARFVFGLAALLCAPFALAAPAGVDSSDPLVGIDRNRVSIISDIVQGFQAEIFKAAPGNAQAEASRLRDRLSKMRADRLLAASLASSYTSLKAIVEESEGLSDAAFEHVRLKALGDPNSDLVYTPLTPCRLIDTRGYGAPIVGGAFAPDTRRAYVPSGLCAIPAAGVVTMLVSFTTQNLTPGSGGYLAILAPGLPITTSVDVFNLGTEWSASNAAVATGPAGQFDIFVSTANAHVVVDILGYFSPALGASSGGTVTSVTAGSGLTGGTITGSGTIGIATGGIGTAQLADGALTGAKIAANGCTNGQMLQYNGSAWVCATGSTGPTGPAGDDGAAGAAGSTGPAGAAGSTGPAGAAGSQGAQGNIGATGAAGSQGAQGKIGTTGSQGAQGKVGAAGATGTAGKTVLNGTTAPVAGDGIDGDFFLDTALSVIYGPKAAGAWPAGVSLVGAAGSQGAQGKIGTTGSQGAQGKIGTTGSQGAQGKIGTTGSQGAQGKVGAAGATGTAGKTVLNGTTAPVAGDGIDGDFFLDTALSVIYGPKAAGAWPAGVSLVGAAGSQGAQGKIGTTGSQGAQGKIGTTGSQGAQGKIGTTGSQGAQGKVGAAGATGTAGKTVLNGTTAPVAGDGIDGDFFLDTALSVIYGPKAAGAWPAGISLVGAAGSQGAQGKIGTTGSQGAQGKIGTTGSQGVQGKIGAGGAQGVQGKIGAGGAQGVQGKLGDAGATGTAGKTVLNGTTAPVAGDGIDGDFFLDTALSVIYGPKAAGAWPAGVSLVGAAGSQGAQGKIGTTGSQGAQGKIGTTGSQGVQGKIGAGGAQGVQGKLGDAGATGAAGKTVLNGTTAPVAGDGIDGDFFLDTALSVIYGPKAAGAWPAGVSLVGAAGSQGAQGKIGATGPPGPTTTFVVAGGPQECSVISSPCIQEALCGPGAVATGGGFEIFPPGRPSYKFVRNVPNVNMDNVAIGWDIEFESTSAISFYFRAFAVCAPAS